MDARRAVALPPRVKTHLGLDDRSSRVICDEYNEFDWPGVDLDVTTKGRPDYGFVPDALIDRVRAQMRDARSRGTLRGTVRTT